MVAGQNHDKLTIPLSEDINLVAFFYIQKNRGDTMT